MSDTELILFSGGPDSTILLKHFLEQRKKVRVLYIEMGWALRTQPRIKFQNIAANNVLNYLKEKYGNFEYSQASILTTLNEKNEDKYFGTDHQWCAFFGSMFCHNYNIKKMWAGNYSYTDLVVRKRDGKSEDYLHNGDLNMYIESATKFFNKPKYCTPKSEYNGTGIDSFKNKKEAWDSLEIDLKKMVRSCISNEWFCGNCSKCWTSREYNLRDEKGNPL
tara:strand:+ start:619 stop:1278 length:660 start_codon:yes stop_codon:yes gene_type:complete